MHTVVCISIEHRLVTDRNTTTAYIALAWRRAVKSVQFFDWPCSSTDVGRRTQGRPGAVGPSRVLLPGGAARPVAAVRQRSPRGGGRRPRSRDLLAARQLHLQEQALAQGPVQDAVRLRQRLVGARFYPRPGRNIIIIIIVVVVIGVSSSSSASRRHKTSVLLSCQVL